MQDKKVGNNILINRLSSLNKKVPVQDVNILFWRYKIYIYKRLRPRKKNPQQKKERAAEIFIEIEHQTS
jgi:hypothetical protein